MVENGRRGGLRRQKSLYFSHILENAAEIVGAEVFVVGNIGQIIVDAKIEAIAESSRRRGVRNPVEPAPGDLDSPVQDSSRR